MSAALRAREEAALARIAGALGFTLNPARLRADDLEDLADTAENVLGKGADSVREVETE